MSFQKRVCIVTSVLRRSQQAVVLLYLVTITPEEVLGTDVLVGVLGLLLTRVEVLLVLDVLPVGIPPQLGVDASNDDAGDSDAADVSLVTVT